MGVELAPSTSQQESPATIWGPSAGGHGAGRMVEGWANQNKKHVRSVVEWSSLLRQANKESPATILGLSAGGCGMLQPVFVFAGYKFAPTSSNVPNGKSQCAQRQIIYAILMLAQLARSSCPFTFATTAFAFATVMVLSSVCVASAQMPVEISPRAQRRGLFERQWYLVLVVASAWSSSEPIHVSDHVPASPR